MHSLKIQKNNRALPATFFRVAIVFLVCISVLFWAYIGTNAFLNRNFDARYNFQKFRNLFKSSNGNFAKFSDINNAFVLSLHNPVGQESDSVLPTVMVMTPVQNCAQRLGRYFGLIEKTLTQYSADRLSISFLDSGSTDEITSSQLDELKHRSIPFINNLLVSHGNPVRLVVSEKSELVMENEVNVANLGGTVQRLLLQVPRLMELGVRSIRIARYDYPFKIDRSRRHQHHYQLERRSTIAMSRNRLTNLALSDSFDFFFVDSFCPDTRTLFNSVDGMEEETQITGVSSNCVLISESHGWIDQRKPDHVALPIPKVSFTYDYTLLIDADLLTYEADVLLQLLSLRKEIVVPLATLRDSSESYDLNSWRANDTNSLSDNTTAEEVLLYHTEYHKRAGIATSELIVQGYAPSKVLFVHSLPKLGDGVQPTPLFHMDLSKREKQMYLEVNQRVLLLPEPERKPRLYRVDCIGGTMALIAGRLFYQGLYFPSYVLNHRIETEALSLVALRLKSPALSWATPDIVIVHA